MGTPHRIGSKTLSGRKVVFIHKNSKLFKAKGGVQTLLHEAYKEPTKGKQPVMGIQTSWKSKMLQMKERGGGCGGQEGWIHSYNVLSWMTPGCPRPGVHQGQLQRANHKFRFENGGPPHLLSHDEGSSPMSLTQTCWSVLRPQPLWEYDMYYYMVRMYVNILFNSVTSAFHGRGLSFKYPSWVLNIQAL